jgi:multiple antibiotic resistance protein
LGPSLFANDFFFEAVTLFVILDPVATVPVFLSVTGGLERRRQLQVAFYALLIAFLVLLFFICVGQILLTALHIPMASFQLAGSIVLLLFGLRMVLGKVIEDAESLSPETTTFQRAVFPLALPGIAGAGSILTVMLLTDNKTRSIAEQAATTGILLVCLVLLFGVFAASGLISRVLGRPGIEIVSRVFGLIMASIAVTNMIAAVKMSSGLPY